MADPQDSWAAIDNSAAVWDQIDNEHTVTSTLSPAQAARQRLAKRGITPEQVKGGSLAPTEYSGPFADYGIKDKADPDHSFLSGKAAKQNFNPLNILDAGLEAASNFVPMGAAPGMQRPPQELTAGNLSRDMGSIAASGAFAYPPAGLAPLALPTTYKDVATEATRRGNAGQSTMDMFQGPAALAGGMALVKGVNVGAKAFSNAYGDIANDMSLKAQRSALGSKPESFQHGAEPDVYSRELGPQLSEGRLLRRIQQAKADEFDSVGKDLDKPEYNRMQVNPRDSITPVLDDARSRAIGDEGSKIQQFDQKVADKINAIGKDGMVTPKGLNELRKWIDGFISTYKEEPTGTIRDMAQNLRAALRKQLETVAPEVTAGNHVIQSFIQAEEDVFTKSHSLQPPPTTFASIVRNTLKPMIPDTWIKTKAASTLKTIAGKHGELPPVNVGNGAPPPGKGPGFTAAPFGSPQVPGGGGFQESTPALSPAPPKLLGAGPEPPAAEASTPPSAPGPDVPPPPTMPNGKGGKGAWGKGPRPGLHPDIADANAVRNGAKFETPPGFNPNRTGMDDLPTRTPEELSAMRDKIIRADLDKKDAARNSNLPPEVAAKPTHVKEGQQVSGIGTDGTLVSGNLEKLDPMIEKGKPVWKGYILDARNGKLVSVDATNIFPREGEVPAHLRPTKKPNAVTNTDSTPAPAAPAAEKKVAAPPKTAKKTGLYNPEAVKGAGVQAPERLKARLKEQLRQAVLDRETDKTVADKKAQVANAPVTEDKTLTLEERQAQELQALIDEQAAELKKEKAKTPKKKPRTDEE